jgi:hypothetical protein
MVEADFLGPLAEFEKGKLAEGRELKHKYYNATLAFDAQKDKVSSLMKNQEKNAAKLPVAEAELDNLARARDQIGREVAASLRAIEADKKEQLYEKMNSFLVAQYGYHQNVYELLRESESFMEGLTHRARGGTAASLASAKAAVVGKASAVMAGGMAALGLGVGAGAAAVAVSSSNSNSNNTPTPFDDDDAVDPSNPFAASPAKPAAVAAAAPAPAPAAAPAAAAEANPFDDPPTGRPSVGRKSLPAPPPKAGAAPAADPGNPFAPAAVVGAGAAGVALAGAGIAGAMSAAKSATPESTLAQASSAAETAKAKAAEASALAAEKTAEAQRVALEKQKQAMELAQEKAKEQMKGNPFGQMAVGMVGAKAATQMESATNSAADKVKGNIDAKNQAIASTSDKVSANSEKLAGMAAQVPK